MNTEPMTIEENSLKINAKSNADNRANDLFDFSYGSEMPEDFNLKYLHRIFENSATVFPEHTAILFENESISYSELNKKANQMASWLQSKGIQQGDFVGILLKRSVEFYISMLGILKAGAAYVPLDISYPVDRVKYIMEDAGVKLVISHSYFKERFLHFTGNIFNADIEFKNIFNDHFIDTNPDINFGNHSSAYVIYTSGSTGLPKGVVISHAAVCNLVKAEQKIFPLTQKDKVIQGFSIAFDASIEEIWLAFASGATLFPVSEDIMHSGADLADFIKLHQITTLSTVPTLLSMMQPILPSLKLLILGGENCPHELLQRWNSRGLRITNTYGPTEATVIATYADFNTEEKITIGKPVPNYAVFILDENLKPVPQGVSGELCIGGKGLATGYLNRDELNHEKFIIPSFPIKNNFPQRIYRSGDLARYNEKGQLEFLGRIDSQVKLRGYRIELAEIESQLLLIDNIKNAAVVVKEGEFKVQRLIAYIILKDTSKPFNEELCRQYLKSKLAPYMIPAMFLVLHEFPKLASGKTDRKNLPEPDYTPKAGYREIIEPVTYEELKIYELWKRYFAPQQVSSTDDFFDLGGHSLIASLIVSELRKTEGFEQISVPDIYEFRTIEKLAAKVAQFKSTNRDRENKNSKDTEFHKVSKGRFVLTTLLQTGSFYLLLLVTSTGLLSPFVLERLFPDISTYQLIGFSTLFAISTFPALIIVSIIFKWVLVGKFKEGRYPLWGSYYFKFWLVKKFIDLTPLGLLAGTPFLNFYFRLMGAKIGKGVYLGSERIRVFDLCTIGEGSSIAREAHLTGFRYQRLSDYWKNQYR